MKLKSILIPMILSLNLAQAAAAPRTCIDLFRRPASRSFLVAPFDHRDRILQSEIDKALSIVADSEFEVDRPLASYIETFHLGADQRPIYVHEYSLGRSLLRLNSNSHVLDLGAGAFKPLRQLSTLTPEKIKGFGAPGDHNYDDLFAAARKVEREGSPNLTGVTLVDFKQKSFRWGPRDERTQAEESIEAVKASVLENPKIQPFMGRYFEDVPDEELLGRFGPVDLVLDRSGVLAYTLNLPLVLEKLSRIMRPGAELWLFANHVRVRTPGGILSLPEFLATIPGFERIEPTSRGNDTGASLFRRTNESFVRPKLSIESLTSSNPNYILYKAD